MPATFPGYVPPSNVVIDAGVLYLTTDGLPLASNGSNKAPFGASVGGFTFDPGFTTRAVEYDGKHTRMQGLDRITEWASVLKGKLVEITAPNMLRYNPGASSDGSSGTNTLTMKAAGVLFQATDYLKHLYLIGRQQVDGQLVRVHFPLALCVKYQIVTQHNNEWQVDAQFDAVLPAGSDPQACPFVYEFLS